MFEQSELQEPVEAEGEAGATVVIVSSNPNTNQRMGHGGLGDGSAEGTEQAAEDAAGGTVSFVGFVPVAETFCGIIIWQGTVDIFIVESDLPTKVYAWSVENGDDWQYIAVLGTPAIDSPRAAVRAWLVSMSKK